jgi:hypothetical protein
MEEFIFKEILAEYESLLNVFPVGLHVVHGQDLLMVFETPLWNSIILLAYNTGTGPLRNTLQLHTMVFWVTTPSRRNS